MDGARPEPLAVLGYRHHGRLAIFVAILTSVVSASAQQPPPDHDSDVRIRNPNAIVRVIKPGTQTETTNEFPVGRAVYRTAEEEPLPADSEESTANPAPNILQRMLGELSPSSLRQKWEDARQTLHGPDDSGIESNSGVPFNQEIMPRVVTSPPNGERQPGEFVPPRTPVSLSSEEARIMDAQSRQSELLTARPMQPTLAEPMLGASLDHEPRPFDPAAKIPSLPRTVPTEPQPTGSPSPADPSLSLAESASASGIAADTGEGTNEQEGIDSPPPRRKVLDTGALPSLNRVILAQQRQEAESRMATASPRPAENAASATHVADEPASAPRPAEVVKTAVQPVEAPAYAEQAAANIHAPAPTPAVPTPATPTPAVPTPATPLPATPAPVASTSAAPTPAAPIAAPIPAAPTPAAPIAAEPIAAAPIPAIPSASVTIQTVPVKRGVGSVSSALIGSTDDPSAARPATRFIRVRGDRLARITLGPPVTAIGSSALPPMPRYVKVEELMEFLGPLAEPYRQASMHAGDDARWLTSTAEETAPNGADDGLKSIQEVKTDIRPTEGELPENAAAERFALAGSVRHGPGTNRDWTMYQYWWQAPALCHSPLYYEEINLERYGYSHGALQPAFSAAHFFGVTLSMPYLMTAEPPQDCQYTLGHYRPGSYAPAHLYRPPFSVKAAAVQAGAVTGLIFLLP